MSQTVGIQFLSHPAERTWEEYAFGRLPTRQIEHVEEHMLACSACQTTLEQVDDFLQSMRAAAPAAAKPPSSVSRQLQDWLRLPFGSSMAMLAIATAMTLFWVSV